MRVFQWSQLSDQQQADVLARPAQSQSAELQQQVAAIIDAVANEGDAAVLRYTRQFDCETLNELRYSEADISAQANKLSTDVQQAIDTAYATIRAFHLQQQPQDIRVET